MEAHLFLDNFATVAEAPDGVSRLRELVRHLAVRGRLVEQDHDDEPAEGLLKSIEESLLVAPSSLMEAVTPKDALWEIPGSWRWARLKQVCDFSAGRTPSTKDANFWADHDGYHWVAISDMPDGGEVRETARLVSAKALEEVFRSAPDPVGTLLMSFKLTIGKMARLAVPAFHNEAIVSIASPYVALQEYLFRALPLLTKTGDSKAAIMGNTLNKTSLTNLLVPVPPLAEQARIVAKVDDLLGLCDDVGERQARRLTAQAALSDSLVRRAWA
jgi:type I restriction enzyme S subunit